MSFYLYYIGLLNNSTTKKNSKHDPKLSHLLIILVISSVVGLIYLFEMDLDVINNNSFNLILNLFMVILGSILIPSLLSLTRKSEPQTNKIYRVRRSRYAHRRRTK